MFGACWQGNRHSIWSIPWSDTEGVSGYFEIYIGARSMARVPSHRRNIGMVFQDYALFQHVTVAQNVGFGFRMRALGPPAIVAQVSEVLALVGLEGFQKRMAQLSRGQQQRVALARALVIKPAVLLLDKPLSALDKKLREEMRSEISRGFSTLPASLPFL
jgi:ABC-type Fe3+/spermidine/putrescine transport system ATPase subunit